MTTNSGPGLTFYDESTSNWKYLVLGGAFFNHVIVWGVAWGAGVFQVIFMHEFGGPGHAGMISIIPTLLSTFMCFVGPVASALTNRFDCRVVTWAGTLLMSLGLALSSFADSVWSLYITFTLIGIGCGIAFIPSIVVVCRYFEKRRPIAVAIASSGLGVGTFIMPVIVRILVHEFYWRGSLVILSAITLNMGAAAMLFFPIHTPETVHHVHKRRKIIRVKMLKEFPFMALVINNILCLYGIVAFFIHLPAHLETVGFTEDEAAMFVSLIGAATMISRLVCGLVVQQINAPVSLYALTIGIAGVAVCATGFLRGIGPIITACIIFGLGSATLGPLLPLILTELVGIAGLSDGYGYIMMAEGIGSLLGPPISGFMYDLTSTYTASLCLAGGTMIAGSLLMLLPLYHLRQKRLKVLLLANIGSLQCNSDSKNVHDEITTTPDLAGPDDYLLTISSKQSTGD